MPLAPQNGQMFREDTAVQRRTEAAAPEPEAKAGQSQNPIGELRLGKPSAKEMNFFYVYILQSQIAEERFYAGYTDDLQTRLMTHNSGHVPHTSKSRPWRINTAVAFTDRQRAIEFERYLKSASGRAFAKKEVVEPPAQRGFVLDK